MNIDTALNALNEAALDVRAEKNALRDQLDALDRILTNGVPAYDSTRVDLPLNVDDLNHAINKRDDLLDAARNLGADDVAIMDAATGQDDYAAPGTVAA